MNFGIKKFVSTAENKIMIILGLSFFVGIWHALPLQDLISDEMYFTGGVLRAMEHHSFLPLATDVPYGTLTYFLNYLLIGFFLLVLLPFFHFDFLQLKLFVLNSSNFIYLSPRLINSMLAIIYLFLIYKILKKEINDSRTRIFLIILLFTNIITSLILHTGKMWVLSVLLVLISFYYLYKAVNLNEPENKELKKDIFLSILFSFLAFSNFPLNVFSLINIPILAVFFRKRGLMRCIFKCVLAGVFICALVVLSNFGGIKSQVLSLFPTSHLLIEVATKNSIIDSLFLNVEKLFLLFPLMILTFILVVRDKIKNRKLFAVSLLYFLSYFLLISIAAYWSANFTSALRYLFPLGFFLIFIIGSFNVHFSRAFYVIGFVSLIYFLLTLYYLSVPTTHNQAYNWVLANLNDQNTVIINNVTQLQIPKNKTSYLLEKEESCASRCRNVIVYNLNDNIRPLVIDQYTRDNVSFKAGDIYYIEESVHFSDNMKLIKTFKNDINDKFFYLVDWNMGSYFDWNYFRIKNLGKNIYIYKQI